MEWARFLNNHFLETCELSQQIAMEIKRKGTSLGTKYMIWQYIHAVTGKEKKSLLQAVNTFVVLVLLTKYLICLGTRRGRHSWQGMVVLSIEKYYNTLLQMCYRKPSDLQFCPPSAPSLSQREHTLELTHQNEIPKSKQNVNRKRSCFKNSKFNVTVRKPLGFCQKLLSLLCILKYHI